MEQPPQRQPACPGILLEVGDFALGVSVDRMQSIRDVFAFDGIKQVFPDVPVFNILAYCYVYSIERLLRDMVWLAGNSLHYDFSADQGFNEAWCSFNQTPATSPVSQKLVTILDCVLLKDLKGTIKRRDLWQGYFKKTFGTPAKAERFFEELSLLRNHVAHLRGMGPDDLGRMEQLRKDLMTYLQAFLKIDRGEQLLTPLKKEITARLGRKIPSLKIVGHDGYVELSVQYRKRETAGSMVLGCERTNKSLQEYLSGVDDVFFYSVSSARLLLFVKNTAPEVLVDILETCDAIIRPGLTEVSASPSTEFHRKIIADDRKFLNPRHPFVRRGLTGWPFENPGDKSMADLARYIADFCSGA